MHTYEIQIINFMVTSIKEVVKADSVVSVKNKAREVFSFNGDDKYIIVNKILNK